MSARICVSIPPKTIDEAFELIKKAEELHPDLIEIRLDKLKNYAKLADIPKHSKIPLIATNKSMKNHGYFSGTEIERQKILLDSAKYGFDYVDIDMFVLNKTDLINNLKKIGTKVIISFHDFEKTPPILELKKILKIQLGLGADICKIITSAKTFDDNLIILNFVSEASKKSNIVCFAMGEHGKISRLLSPFFGGVFTFASLTEKRKTAKGQLTIQEMKYAYNTMGLK